MYVLSLSLTVTYPNRLNLFTKLVIQNIYLIVTSLDKQTQLAMMKPYLSIIKLHISNTPASTERHSFSDHFT